MEWKVFYRRGVPPITRRTAVIQLCDRNTILIVQVSAMKSAYAFVAPVIVELNKPLSVPAESEGTRVWKLLLRA